MNDGLKLLDVVALECALPQKGLERGQVGTIVEVLSPGWFEVEFSADDGRAYAFAAVAAADLIRLRYAQGCVGDHQVTA